MEKTVRNPVDTLPAQFRSLFIEIIGAKDADLLASLSSQGEPSQEERPTVEEILSTEFCRNLQADVEPTERGRDIDNMLGAFLMRYLFSGSANDDWELVSRKDQGLCQTRE
jgi:hypothetical protein